MNQTIDLSIQMSFESADFDSISRKFAPYLSVIITKLTFLRVFLVDNMVNVCGELSAEGITEDYATSCTISYVDTFQQWVFMFVIALAVVTLLKCFCPCSTCLNIVSMVTLSTIYLMVRERTMLGTYETDAEL